MRPIQLTAIMSPIKRSIIGLFIILVGLTSLIGFQFARLNLQKAETLLNQNSLNDEVATDLNQLKTVQQELKTVASNLEKIPVFVSSKIQTTLARLHLRLSTIEQKIKAEEQAFSNLEIAKNLANEASQLAGQSPPSLEHLVKSQKKWQEGINLLKQIPHGSSLAIQVKERLLSYQDNYTMLATKLDVEKKGIDDLKAAFQAAEQAATLTKNRSTYTASILINAKVAWQRTVELLGKITPETMAATEAQPQLANFQKNIQNIDISLKHLEQCQATASELEENCNTTLDIIDPPTQVASTAESDRPSEVPPKSTANASENSSSDSSLDGSSGSSSYSPSYVPRHRSSGSVYVPPYTRGDGTPVRGYTRSSSSSSSRSGGFGSSRSSGSSS